MSAPDSPVTATSTTYQIPVDGIGPVPLTVTARGEGRPYLVLHGGADRSIPLPVGELLRDGLPGALDLIVIPGAGHTPSLTHPDQVNGSLAAFLRQRA